MSLPPPESERKLAMSPDADTGTGPSKAPVPMATSVGTVQQQQQGYQHKKIGDLLEEVNDMLTRKRERVTARATEKVHGMLDELKALYHDLTGMANESPERVDPAVLKRKQNHLNELENSAVGGVYGAEAQICPLDEPGQPVHHVRIQAIPPGQATVRDLIEKCHQMVTRVMDRLEESVTSMEGAQQATSTATTTTTVHTGGVGARAAAGAGAGHAQQKQPQIQTHTTGTTLMQGDEHHQQQPTPHHVATEKAPTTQLASGH